MALSYFEPIHGETQEEYDARVDQLIAQESSISSVSPAMPVKPVDATLTEARKREILSHYDCGPKAVKILERQAATAKEKASRPMTDAERVAQWYQGVNGH